MYSDIKPEYHIKSPIKKVIVLTGLNRGMII